MKRFLLPFAALALAAPAIAREEPQAAPSPNEIVDAASKADWVRIAPQDLLVMTLAPAADGSGRQAVIQLMPPPFSQGWVENIRTLARAHWYDGISINRVQDNYVVQWGDPGGEEPETAKPLPDGLRVMGEEEYTVDVETLGAAPDITYDHELPPESLAEIERNLTVLSDGEISAEAKMQALDAVLSVMGLYALGEDSDSHRIAMISIESTKTASAPQGWHERDSFAEWVEIWRGWPIANYEKGHWEDDEGKTVSPPTGSADTMANGPTRVVDETRFWPVHCYGTVGVGRGLSPDTGTGAELYTVIGHAPRHLDRNIAVVGRVIEGIEHLSSLPRGTGPLGFYLDESKRVPIASIRLASDLPESERPAFEYLDTDSEAFTRYADARANRRDPFFIVPAGGADVCNIPVPVRRVTAAE